MSDRRRIVTLSPGGRPILELDLEVAPNYQAIKDTFAFTPGARNQQASREPGRYGGQIVVGETNDNGQVSWQALVAGSTVDQVAQNIEALLAAVERTPRNRLFEWRPDGATYSGYARIAGPGTWKPTYSWSQITGAHSMVVDVAFPARPLWLWDPMTISDPFDADSRGDYTFDALTSADVAVSSATLAPAGASNASERRARHTIRGYSLLEGQATVKSTPGVTITSYKAGVILRGTSAANYVEVYVDDNGTNSRLRIDVVIAGVRTGRASVNLGSRVSNGTPFWVRGRVVGGVVFAEHFTSAPTPTAAPTTVSPSGGAGYTLVGGDAPLNTTAGYSGWSWIPQNTNAALDDFEFRPFYRKGVTVPAVTRYVDAIPGTAPALADVTVVSASGSGAAPFGLIGWAPSNTTGQLSTGPAVNSVAILDSTNATTRTVLTEGAQALSYGGSDSRTTAAGAVTGTLDWLIEFADFVADDFADDTIDLEIWARLILTSSLVNPRAIVSLTAGSIASQYPVEFGSTGRTLVKPSSGTVYRLTRLGVIPFDATFNLADLILTIKCDTGSTGAFGIDYAKLVPARRRALSPTNVDGSTGYPVFSPGSAQIKTIRSDLSGLAGSNLGQLGIDSGLGGALIQPAAGSLDLLVDAHERVPDDPASSSGTDPLGQVLTTALDVVPRSYMLRSA